MAYWKKCGKILTDSSNSVISADECPCGYYGLFAIVSFSFDPETEVVNYCYPSIEVIAAHVVQNRIIYSYMENICIPVGRQPDSNGRVGYKKGSFGCHEECVEWSANYDECLRTETVCYAHLELSVYRLSGIYDDYKSFATYFYGGCDVEPNSEGKYPDIFDDQGNISGNAYNCIYGYWQELAHAKFRPRATFTLETYTWELKMHPFSAEYVMSPEGYPDHQTCNAIAAEYRDSAGGVVWKYYCFGGSASWNDDCGWGYGCWEYEYPTCCDVWNNFPDKLGEVNSFYNSRKNQPEQFYMTEQIIEIPTKSWGYDHSNCFSFEYRSQYVDWIGYFSDLDRYSRWGKLKVKKSESTYEDATGVILLITAYIENGTNEGGCVTPNGERTYLYEDQEVTLKFGEEKDFPLCDNIKDFFITNEQDCSEDCENGSWPSCAPRGDFTGQFFHCDVAVKSYVF